MDPRTSVVVGANRGIGLELARQLIARGDHVVATARDVDAAAALAALRPAAILHLDLGDDTSFEAFGLALANEVETVDLLINNAGIGSRTLGHDSSQGVLDAPSSTLLEMTRINAVGPMLVVRATLPLLETGGGAWVVNISSTLGSMEVGRQMGDDVAYKVSKAALNMITVSAARELSDRGVRFAAFHPGWVRTDMGGPAAPLVANDSVAGVLSRIDTLDLDDNGGFFNWDGSTHPW